jgi:hypothetical protein
MGSLDSEAEVLEGRAAFPGCEEEDWLSVENSVSYSHRVCIPQSRAELRDLSGSNYGPTNLSHRSQSAFGRHPCRVVSISYEQTLGCHGTARGNGKEREGNEGNSEPNRARIRSACDVAMARIGGDSSVILKSRVLPHAHASARLREWLPERKLRRSQ